MDTRTPQGVTGVNWSDAKAKLAGTLSVDESRIVDLLIAKKSTPDIAKALGTNRSAVWRKIQKIKESLRGVR